MNYLIIFILLTLIMLGYLELAKKFNIIDKPNERSSHVGLVVRGGGIVFVAAGIIWALENLVEPNISIMSYLIGLVALSIVSFIDDIKTLGTKLRMGTQFLACALILYASFHHLDLSIFHFFFGVIITILLVAMLNAYNFMDGINGINGLYSLSVLLAVTWSVFRLNITFFPSLDKLNDYLILSILIFGFFNFRKKALCFSGDIGSIGIAFSILFILLSLSSGNINLIPLCIIFLLIYGVDAFWTVFQRFIRGEKITEAHRLHLYQLLSNEMKIPHLIVSGSYFLGQLIISIISIEIIRNQWINTWIHLIIILIFTSLIYIVLKLWVHKKIGKSVI